MTRFNFHNLMIFFVEKSELTVCYGLVNHGIFGIQLFPFRIFQIGVFSKNNRLYVVAAHFFFFIM